jgi:uncharacterized protein (UPF0276 family)
MPSPSAGVGLKPEHFAEALAAPADGLWLEVHPENFMVAGGPRLAWLEAIRARHPLSLHGVGLSLAADAPPDAAHLARLAALVDRFEPALVSEHLAWSTWGGRYRPDLLPFPRDDAALARVADNVSRVQDALRLRIAIENPAHYLALEHAIGEIEFLDALCARTGCALLLDVNNVYVAARNLGTSAERYVDAFPAERIAEIHVAGHAPDPMMGEALLVDSHDAQVSDAVWALCERALARAGPRPVLLERDGNLPPFDDLLAERAIASRMLEAIALEPA